MRLTQYLSALLALTIPLSSFGEKIAPHTFKIGAILALSGPTAEYGVAMRNAMELARSDHPELFAHLQIIYEDARYDAKSAVAAFQKLRTIDNVDLIYTWGVVFCQALAPLAEAYHLPTIGQCVDPHCARGRRFFLRFQNYADQYVQVAIDYLQTHAIRSIGVVLSENSYMESFYAALEKYRSAEQEIILLGRVLPDEMDLRSVVTRARLRGVDALVILLMPGQVSQFYRLATEQNYRPLTLGTNVFESASEIRAAGGAMNGALVVSNEIDPRFHARYQARYQDESQLSFAALAYEFAFLIAELTQETSVQLPAEELIQKLSTLPPRTGHAAGLFRPRELDAIGKFFEFKLSVKKVSAEELRVVEPKKSSSKLGKGISF